MLGSRRDRKLNKTVSAFRKLPKTYQGSHSMGVREGLKEGRLVSFHLQKKEGQTWNHVINLSEIILQVPYPRQNPKLGVSKIYIYSP